jgi:hypothetical protein
MFLRYAQPCRMIHSAVPSLAPTFLDHQFSTIRPLPAHQHPSDQLLPFLHLLLLPLFSVADFSLPSAAGLVSHSPVEGRGPQTSIRHSHASLIACVPLERDFKVAKIDSGELL